MAIKEGKRFNGRAKVVLFALLAVALVALIVFLVISGALGNVVKDQSAEGFRYTESQKKYINDTSEEGYNLVISGDLKGAVELYDKKIAESETAEVRAALLVEKSRVFYESAGYEDALKYALEAEVLDKTWDAANMAALIHEEMGNRERALFYAKKALEYNDRKKDEAYLANEEDGRFMIERLSGDE